MSESASFLLTRYVVGAIALFAIGIALRRRGSPVLVFGLTVSLGLVSWLYTSLPLRSPYGVQPGSQSSFELAVISVGAARGAPLEGWVVGLRNPRPVWSGLWYVVSRGNSERARALYRFVAPVALVLLGAAVVFALSTPPTGDPWEILCSLFAALFASSMVVDVLEPFSIFFRQFFMVAPHRGLGLGIVILALGFAWRPGIRHGFAAAVLLALTGWLDLTLQLWGSLSLLVLALLTPRPGRGASVFRTALIGWLLSSPQWLSWLRGEMLVRLPSAETVSAFRTAFRDLFAVTTDMGWIFVLAGVAVPLLWKRRRTTDLGLLSLLAASYLLWLLSALTFHWRPFSQPDLAFLLPRFSAGLVAGVGSFQCALAILTGPSSAAESDILRRWLAGKSASGLAFAATLLFLLPVSAPFVWRPLQMDEAYYPSLLQPDTSVARLARWLNQNSDPEEVILSGDETSEWVAALSGRRVLSAPNVLNREQARQNRRRQRGLFTTNDRSSMREALEASGAKLVIWDENLRETYLQFDETLLESSGLFRKVHQIGDRYTIYRAR